MMENQRQKVAKQVEDDVKHKVLLHVSAAWHELAPRLVKVANESNAPLVVWAEAHDLLTKALSLPDGGHTCDGFTCEYGYAHSAGL